MITVKKIPDKFADRQYSTYLVLKDDKEIGLLEKWKNTRTDFHPWKAILGIGLNCTFLKAFYPAEGGKQAAIDAVVAAFETLY